MEYKEYSEDDNYLIYQDGRVFSKKTNKFLKGKVDDFGHQKYCLTIHSKSLGTYKKHVYAHCLVTETFILNSDDSKKTYKNNQNERIMDKKEARYIEKNLPGEIWKDIKDHSLYQVSNMGRVRNKRTLKWLRQDETHKYNQVYLTDDMNHKHNVMVHKLVYCVFNDDYDLKNFVIKHIDLNTKNNKLSNLQKQARYQG